MTNLTGQSIGRYHLLEQLGQGGMAVVYKAYDTRLEREVAVKVIRRDAFPPNQLDHILQRFEREAKSLARLNHPNIIKVYDYGDHEGSPYLVMEYQPGGTLKQRLGQALPWEQAVRLLLPVAEALAYAHEQKMVHRDVKPANILLTPKGQPMLTDFGVAKILDLEDGQTLTGTGVGVGTPEYMAPEQWTNKTVPQSDMYGLGVVLYELVTGRKPYIADTPAALLLKQANDPLPRPSTLNPAVPDALEKVLLKMLARDPADRYADMDGLASALEGLVRSGPGRQPEPVRPVVEDSGETRMEEPTGEGQTVDEMPAPLEASSLSGQNWWSYWPWVGVVVLLGLALSVGNGLVSLGTQGTGPLAGLATGTNTATLAPSLTQTKPPTSISTLSPTATATANLAEYVTDEREADGMVMVYVPAGSFEMGSEQGEDDEKPVHTVSLDAFWIDRTEVTNTMYRMCVDAGECNIAIKFAQYYNNGAYADHPVVYVTWNDANAYCQWAGARLPTEAEWEKAARGTDGRIYPWGDEFSCSRGNFDDETVIDTKVVSGGVGCDGYDLTSPAGSFASGASPYGALDMAGNVWEWVADWYGEDYYSSSPVNNPLGPPSGENRVLRGGSLTNFFVDTTLRSTDRIRLTPGYINLDVGFRCAYNAP